MTDEHATHPNGGHVTLPDRVTVLTCIGCGAMGRQERCVNCSEHKLELVRASDYERLLSAALDARTRALRLAPVVREYAALTPDDRGDGDGERLREMARQAVVDNPTAAVAEERVPEPVVGWWCAECGNVDMPQPCIGVCVWKPAVWVNLALYERQRRLAEPWTRAERALSRFLTRARSVRPRAGQELRHWSALRAQAVSALRDYDQDVPAPEQPRAIATEPRALVLPVFAWPR